MWLFVKENLARSAPFCFPGRRSIVACLDGGSLSAGVGCVMLEHSFDWFLHDAHVPLLLKRGDPEVDTPVKLSGVGFIMDDQQP